MKGVGPTTLWQQPRLISEMDLPRACSEVGSDQELVARLDMIRFCTIPSRAGLASLSLQRLATVVLGVLARVIVSGRSEGVMSLFCCVFTGQRQRSCFFQKSQIQCDMFLRFNSAHGSDLCETLACSVQDREQVWQLSF